MRYTQRMENIRRAIALRLVQLARQLHPTILPPPEVITKTVVETVIVGDDEWREQRISALHRANQDLVRVNERNVLAFQTCVEFFDRLRTTKKQRADLNERLRRVFTMP